MAIDFEALADEDIAATPQDLLGVVGVLAKLQVSLENQLAEIDAHRAVVEAQLVRVSSVELPEAMRAVGLSSLKLDDGRSIEVEKGVASAITKATESAAFKWLEDNEHGDLIKNNVTVAFGKGEDARAQELVRVLEAAGFDDYAMKRSVHPQTLKAFITEQLEKGEVIPTDTFNLFPYTVTKIVKPRAKKVR